MKRELDGKGKTQIVPLKSSPLKKITYPKADSLFYQIYCSLGQVTVFILQSIFLVGSRGVMPSNREMWAV